MGNRESEPPDYIDPGNVPDIFVNGLVAVEETDAACVRYVFTTTDRGISVVSARLVCPKVCIPTMGRFWRFRVEQIFHADPLCLGDTH